VQERLDVRLREMPSGAIHQLIVKLSEIDEFRGWWRGRRLSSASTLRRVKPRVVEISANLSTQIDGRNRASTAVEPPARGARTGGAERHCAGLVAGYAELLRAVFDGYREMQFGQDLILQFHARLLRYSPKDQHHRGKYRTLHDVGTSYLRRKMEPLALRSADPDLTPRALAAATDWAATRLVGSDFHPLLVIAGFILEFLAIRPFTDGNGRLSRVLTNLLLLQSGYTFVSYASLDKVVADQWTEYYLALRRSQTNANLPHPDITPWLNAFLDAVRAQMQQVRTLAEGQPDDTLLSGNQLRVLNLFERNREVTNRFVRRELDMPKDTAKQVLNRLVALNLVRRVGAGRAVRYRRLPLQEGGGAAR